ncbi:MAG: penicillin acylase family protein [Roseiflexaceae bacterium]
MASFKRIGATAGIVLGAAAGLAGVGLMAVLRRSLPRTTGALALPGLESPVQVLRDRWGVPHIYARSNADLFMAQGYVHAQDRLWQMELHRRTGQGQLAEIFGPIALESDRFLRVMGFGRVARRETELLAGAAREAIEAYVRGVNTYISQYAGRLPIEFTILRLRPRPWEPADVLVWGKMMALTLSENWTDEILRARIVAAVGAERAAALEPDYDGAHPLIIPPGIRYRSDIGADALRGAAAVAAFAGEIGGGQGSNNWAVGGARAANGMPLLANDPHLSLQLPSLWYENHLSGGDYHVTGVSIPGSPGVIIGHNERIAWGATNAMTDVQDLYIERFDPQDSTRYEFQGQWERAEIVREEIAIRGRSEPFVEEVRVTRHGPVITPLVPTTEEPRTTPRVPDQEPGIDHARTTDHGPRTTDHEQLALRWTALEPGRIFDAVLALNRATNWDSFRAALADWTVPAQNFVYADVEGHIGYALGGDIPTRAQGDGRVPAPGWTGEYEWTGVIPHAELPHALDPETGFVATANNRIVGDEYPYPLPAEWLSGYRATRICELIEQTPRHDTASFAHIQGDLRSLPGLELAALADRLPATSVTAQHARDALAAWDGELTAESIGGTIYARLREKLLADALAEIAGPLGTVTGLGAFAAFPSADYYQRALPQVLRRAAARDDGWLPASRTWDAVLAEAWDATVAELQTEYGDDVRLWIYGRKHVLTFRHPLDAVPTLARLLDRGPFPTGGDVDTVRMGHLPRIFAGPSFYVAPSYRQICDTADWDRSQSIHPPGQSGQPGSRHYADLLQHWLRVEYHPMLWSRARVEAAAVDRLTLEPENRPT